MIQTIVKRFCDVCKKEVQHFAGSLKLEYDDKDHTGCYFPVEIEYKDICLDCCRKLKKTIREV